MPREPLVLSARSIRNACRGDVAALVALDEAAFEFIWPENAYTDALKDPQCTIRVVDHDGGVIALMITFAPRNTHNVFIERFAVAAQYRRRSVGQQLLATALQQRGKRISCWVPGELLDAQLFLRSCGFRCVAIHKNWFEFGDNTTDDGYEMVYGALVPPRKPGKPRGPLTVDLRSRLDRHLGRKGSGDED